MTFDNALTTFSIAITSLTAGSIFCFPLFGPSLTRDLGLNLTQTNTIWAGAVLGEYLSAAPWGAIGDHYGPRVLSLSAGIIFLVGYQLMSHAENIASIERQHQSSTEAHSLNKWSFTVTVIAFVLVGSGVAASYFSAVTTSSRTFKSKPGLAIAAPLTLFSLSSLFLTYLGTTFFTNKSGDLDASKFLAFLSILCGFANIFSAFAIKIPQPQADQQHTTSGQEAHSGVDDESTPLIQGRDTSAPPRVPGVPEGQGVVAFMTTPSVWALAFLMVVGVGAAEMVLGSVGNMVVALLGTSTTNIGALFPTATPIPSIGPVALTIRAQQVKLLAAANAVARLAGGFLSDLIAPKAQGNRRTVSQDASTSSDLRKLVSRIEISRITLLLFASLLALGAYLWAAFGLASTDGLPAFSIIVGTSYGLMFSIVPAVTVSAFGQAHFGRNWGLLSYCCAIGSASYSLLYATVSDAIAAKYGNQHGGQGATCLAGRECFQASFVISALGLAASLLALIPVWRRWRRFF